MDLNDLIEAKLTRDVARSAVDLDGIAGFFGVPSAPQTLKVMRVSEAYADMHVLLEVNFAQISFCA